MPQIYKVFFAALAASATLGAVQLASGHDLAGLRQDAPAPAGNHVNRAAKTDRGALKSVPDQTRTITLRAVGLDETSLVVRVPVVTEEARNRATPPAAPGVSKPATSRPKATIACEPPVSVLTEVAKLLQPGRCVT